MSEQKPKISVCIVTYNQKEYIGDCIKSVLMQASDEFDLEILVGDDGSTDGAVQIIAQLAELHPNIVRPYIHQKNLGAARNIQFLVSQAIGDFIAHLDGDDYWLPGKLANQIKFLREHQDCAAVLTNAIVVDTVDNLSGVFSSKIPETFDINFLLERGNFLNFSSLMYRNKFKSITTGLPTPLIDYRIELNIIKNNKFGWVNKSLVVYRDGTSTSLIKNTREHVRQLMWEAIQEAINFEGVSKKSKINSVASFLTPIFFMAIKNKTPTYFLGWLKKTSGNSSKTELIKFLTKNIILSATYRIKSRIGLTFSPKNYIYYPR